MIDADRLHAWEFEDVDFEYAPEDCALYALGLGVGRDPIDPRQLQFVYERELVAIPTMAVSFGWPGDYLADPTFGVDYTRVVHGGQSLIVHRPLASGGRLVKKKRVDAVLDKGEGRGALIVTVDELADRESGEAVATSTASAFCRGDGGFGRTLGQIATAHPLPDRPHDHTFTWPTGPHQALLYRLSGDGNPLHADPAVARAAGFERPILHGLCTYGISALGLIATLCDWRPERLRRIDARFTAPVVPGDVLELRIWQEDPGRAGFRCIAVDHGELVLDNGYCEYDDR